MGHHRSSKAMEHRTTCNKNSPPYMSFCLTLLQKIGEALSFGHLTTEFGFNVGYGVLGRLLSRCQSRHCLCTACVKFLPHARMGHTQRQHHQSSAVSFPWLQPQASSIQDSHEPQNVHNLIRQPIPHSSSDITLNLKIIKARELEKEIFSLININCNCLSLVT